VGRRAGGYRNTINDNVVLILMIETLEGLKNADAIAKVPGVTAVFAASGDLGNFSGFQQGTPTTSARSTSSTTHPIKAGVRLCGPLAWRDRPDFTCFQAGNEGRRFARGVAAELGTLANTQGKPEVGPSRFHRSLEKDHMLSRRTLLLTPVALMAARAASAAGMTLALHQKHVRRRRLPGLAGRMGEGGHQERRDHEHAARRFLEERLAVGRETRGHRPGTHAGFRRVRRQRDLGTESQSRHGARRLQEALRAVRGARADAHLFADHGHRQIHRRRLQGGRRQHARGRRDCQGIWSEDDGGGGAGVHLHLDAADVAPDDARRRASQHRSAARLLSLLVWTQ
jgi:hypothetical protein